MTDDKLEKYTEIIIKQSQKLNKHIEKILNIAKWDNGSMTLEKKEVDIIPIVKEVLDTIRLKYPQINISIKTILATAVTIADEFHFTNVIYNLIDNSIKYCDENPIIIIEIAMTKTHLVLKCVDNGIGISEKEAPFIFDKFYRIANPKNKEVTGFGLGLYYVKKVCTLHQWKIVVKNNTEKGVTVAILMPPLS